MIASGEKKEEYREIKDYFTTRLVDQFNPEFSESRHSFYWKKHLYSIHQPVDYDIIKFYNGGYFKDTIPNFCIEYKGLEVSQGREEWGAEPGKKYFVIKLGEILK